MKKVWIAFFGVFIILSCMQLEKIHNGISDSVIRLHILANSDNESDQRIKLKVRDFVLENYASRLSSDTKEEALRKIYACLPKMLKDVEKFSGQDVKISISESDFPTKIYNGFAFPEGKYLALKIELGSGKGKNWWCVMYPPLCFDKLSTVTDAEKLKKILTKEEFGLVANGETLYKFKVLEIWNRIKER